MNPVASALEERLSNKSSNLSLSLTGFCEDVLDEV